MAKLQLEDRIVEIPDETVAGLTQAFGSREKAAALLRGSLDPEYGRRLMAAVQDTSQPEWTREMGKLLIEMRGIGSQRPPAPSPQAPQPPPAPQASPFQQQGAMPPVPQPQLSLNEILGPLMGRLS